METGNCAVVDATLMIDKIELALPGVPVISYCNISITAKRGVCGRPHSCLLSGHGRSRMGPPIHDVHVRRGEALLATGSLEYPRYTCTFLPPLIVQERWALIGKSEAFYIGQCV